MRNPPTHSHGRRQQINTHVFQKAASSHSLCCWSSRDQWGNAHYVNIRDGTSVRLVNSHSHSHVCPRSWLFLSPWQVLWLLQALFSKSRMISVSDKPRFSSELIEGRLRFCWSVFLSLETIVWKMEKLPSSSSQGWSVRMAEVSGAALLWAT